MRTIEANDLEEATEDIERGRSVRLSEAWVRHAEDALDAITHDISAVHKTARTFDRKLTITFHNRVPSDVFNVLDDTKLDFRGVESAGVGRLSVIYRYPENPPKPPSAAANP